MSENVLCWSWLDLIFLSWRDLHLLSWRDLHLLSFPGLRPLSFPGLTGESMDPRVKPEDDEEGDGPRMTKVTHG